MPVNSIILFIFSFIISFFIILYTYQLKTEFVDKTTHQYFNYMIVTVGYGFFNWIGPYFVIWIFDENSELNINKAILIFSLFALPLLFIKFYLFLDLLLQIVQMSIRKTFKIIYWILSILLIFLFLFLIKHYIDTGNSKILTLSLFLLGIFVSISEYLILLFFIFKAAKLKDNIHLRFATSFGWLYFAGHFVYITSTYSNYYLKSYWVFSSIPYIYFLIHIAPLQILKNFYKKFSSALTAISLPEKAYIQYSISPREKEIILLMMEGNRNKTIGEKLFISPNTVRNHIYNIYQKTGAKNKVHLATLFQDIRKRESS